MTRRRAAHLGLLVFCALIWLLIASLLFGLGMNGDAA